MAKVLTMLDDEFHRSVVELQELVSRTFEPFKELLKKAGDAFHLEMAIESEWSSVKRPSRQRRAEFLAQTQFIRALAKDYSRWIKENPEISAEEINEWRLQLRSASKDEKVAILKRLRDGRIDRLERQLPKFQMMVDQIDASVQRLQEIVARGPN
jgi:hypothetical protein